MIRITILSVGRLQERFWREAAAEYEKRLSRYCALRIVETAEEKVPERAPQSEKRRLVRAEGGRLLRAADPAAPLWALEIRGTRMDSETFAGQIRNAGVEGVSHIQFVIGGSCGLSEEVLERAKMRVSFSDMTFPHQLMRVILLEQIYRSFRIIRGEPYHK